MLVFFALFCSPVGVCYTVSIQAEDQLQHFFDGLTCCSFVSFVAFGIGFFTLHVLAVDTPPPHPPLLPQLF